CKQLATSAHCALQHALTPPYNFVVTVAAVPSCFHFAIIPLTVDCEIFSIKDISWMDLLHRWHPITVPRLNSLSS
ncbi:unnamed protein product, partial [Staurois parvus]